MLKYLIIQLDDTSTSFCHYPNNRTMTNLIPLETLKKAILWSMKENLTIQFLYPDHEIPEEYKKVIAQTFHADIVPSTCEDITLRDNADVVVFNSSGAIGFYPFNQSQAYVLRVTFNELIDQCSTIGTQLPAFSRLTIVITDVSSFTEEDEQKYKQLLEYLSRRLLNVYKKGHAVQVNLLTDRILLDKMNNCNAGHESICLTPDGKFHICPAFYLDGSPSVGDIETGLKIKNPQLYRLDHAPICRICDAYQCRRCIWQNRKLTLEVNTPSHEQCVMAHIERNTSRELLTMIRETVSFFPDKEISEIDYLDPFDIIIRNEHE